MKKIWSCIPLLVIITIMSGCGMNEKETSETNKAQKSTVQSTEISIKLDVPEVIETTETGRFSVTGKTEPKTYVDISYGVNDNVIKSDENGNFKYDGYSLSDEDNSYSVYVSVNTDTETEVKKEITVTRSDESIKKIASQKAKEEQNSREKEDKSELKQQFLGLLQKTLGTTLEVTLIEELTVYSMAPKEGNDQLVSDIAWILAGKDSSSWFDLRDTLVSLSIEFSEKIGEPVTFYLSHDGTMEGNVLRISDGTVLYDGVEERLIEKGYK
ncbi:hypothetical protein P7H41_00255 [Vagococcus fluvialis]|uniref:hypothetical protein n=1 Tax=Vagococcus fluvialis TaxID=2738 RepID=UPI00288F118B|nr:hypothetical protein [Vagococcus fluvialis]MDT2780378.1 hypothetical protein [Vagococcus fluvialis]